MELIRSKMKSVAKDFQEDGTMEVIVNSGKLDRQGEILDINGLDLTDYMENPVVAWGHQYDQPAIGKATKIWKDTTTGMLKATVKFATEHSDMAKLVYNLIKDGYMNAFSIGFIPQEAEENQDGHVVYTKSQMLEFSAVLVPADPRALATAKSLYGDEAIKALEGEISTKDYHFKLAEPTVEKAGRVLNKSNRKLVGDAIKALQAVVDADSKEETHTEAKADVAPTEVKQESSGTQAGRTVTKKKNITQIIRVN